MNIGELLLRDYVLNDCVLHDCVTCVTALLRNCVIALRDCVIVIALLHA